MEHSKTQITAHHNSDHCSEPAQINLSSAPPNNLLGDPDFYDQLEYQRYVLNLSWLRSAVRFGRYRGQKVLEIGFGQGTDLFSFARRGAQVYGIELQPHHIRLARQNFYSQARPCQLAQGNGQTLPFSSNSFDLVYIFDVLPEISLARPFISEINRVLKPGGTAIIGLSYYSSHYSPQRPVINHHQTFSPQPNNTPPPHVFPPLPQMRGTSTQIIRSLFVFLWQFARWFFYHSSQWLIYSAPSFMRPLVRRILFLLKWPFSQGFLLIDRLFSVLQKPRRGKSGLKDIFKMIFAILITLLVLGLWPLRRLTRKPRRVWMDRRIRRFFINCGCPPQQIQSFGPMLMVWITKS